MTQSIKAHFDGSVIVPDEPLHLPIGQVLEVHFSIPDSQPGRFADLASFAADLPECPTDLAEQHDHYLYGTPKR
jgi:hypothetical protein